MDVADWFKMGPSSGKGPSMNPRLIACVLGGTAHRARTELHDVAFAVGNSLDAVYDQLLDSWFGEPHGLHVDAWCYVDQVAGYRVRLSPEPANNGLRLYFVNIGGYRKGEFGERHAWGLFGAANSDEVDTAHLPHAVCRMAAIPWHGLSC